MLTAAWTDLATSSLAKIGKLATLTTKLYIPPVVSQASVSTNLLQPFQILTQFIVQGVTKHLSVAPILNVFLPVEEPVRNLVLTRVGHHCNNTLNLGSRNIKLYCQMSADAWIRSIISNYNKMLSITNIH